MKTLFLIPTVCLLSSLFSNAQVSKIKLGLNYDIASETFELNLIIEEGSATTDITRVLFNSQISLVAPMDANVSILEVMAPIKGNKNYDGEFATNYTISTSVNNNCLEKPERFFSITPSLSPTSYFNDLYPGDTIPLFRFTCSAQYDGIDNIRLFDNDSDPGPSAPCMGGGDFSNGITIGGFKNLYIGNEPTTYLNSYAENIEFVCSDSLRFDLDIIAAGFQKPIITEWTGPNGFISNEEDIIVPNLNLENNGIYILKITNALGVEITYKFDSNHKAEAGIDLTKCENEAVVISGIYPQYGLWRFLGEDLTEIAHKSGESTEGKIELPSLKPGIYQIEYGGSVCPDSMSLIVHPSPEDSIWHSADGIEVNGGLEAYSWFDCENDQFITDTNSAIFIPEVSGSYYALLKNEFCITITECISFSLSSVNTVDNVIARIYPNPTSNAVFIESDVPILNAFIINGLGERAEIYKSNGARFYQLPTMNSGLYFLDLKTKLGSSTHPLIVVE